MRSRDHYYQAKLAIEPHSDCAIDSVVAVAHPVTRGRRGGRSTAVWAPEEGPSRGGDVGAAFFNIS